MVRTQYSIISRGTEKYSNCGYIGISYPLNDKQYILDINHGVLNSEINSHSIQFDAYKYSIVNIALSRFELITQILLNRFKLRDNILILGLGNIGFSCLYSLLNSGYKNISIYSPQKRYNIISLEKHYNVKIKIVSNISDDYDTYIEATGSSNVLKSIFAKIGTFKDIVILSTPRDKSFFIDPLIINRKNLIIVGGHEINGVNKKTRETIFNNLLKKNEPNVELIKKYVNIHSYSDKIVEELLKKKTNFIDVIKYGD